VRPITPPETFQKLRPWTRVCHFGPPAVFTESEVGALDLLVDRSAPLTPQSEIGPCLRIYLELDPDEIEIVKDGKAVVELTLWGTSLQPFQVQVYDREGTA
jgi:hypothetical protein